MTKSDLHSIEIVREILTIMNPKGGYLTTDVIEVRELLYKLIDSYLTSKSNPSQKDLKTSLKPSKIK